MVVNWLQLGQTTGGKAWWIPMSLRLQLTGGAQVVQLTQDGMSPCTMVRRGSGVSQRSRTVCKTCWDTGPYTRRGRGACRRLTTRSIWSAHKSSERADISLSFIPFINTSNAEYQGLLSRHVAQTHVISSSWDQGRLLFFFFYKPGCSSPFVLSLCTPQVLERHTGLTADFIHWSEPACEVLSSAWVNISCEYLVTFPLVLLYVHLLTFVGTWRGWVAEAKLYLVKN